MQIPLDDIRVKRRIREEPEDIEDLMNSMKRYGLMNPITINSENVLIAGRRRLEAARRLGWHMISANVIEATDRVSELEMEIEENTQRSNFTDQELMKAYTRLERLRNPNIFVRIWRAIVAFFRAIFSQGN
ncbi:MAG TPA: ParB N-terminal domain-containing protein [Treponemataceae bacterium]|jgi:ParB family chromosome partitioning protein|nr:ParB N-terminal domain-containing protein [Treponema sp.]OQB04216.1 MAG: Chromosome-partitioning protein Spo0J [Spirochaetes bacterium ADurb.Bin215]HOF85871.1 ParB N-terminal domain-containing protein [Treponemataceae bacterium]HOS35749.1 ParB N-terminal domain-containing protein [Treponemataceae bacterium]HOU38103.1 ParB N-terminal domain-containing protein [Treponemataceae bacterium]